MPSAFSGINPRLFAPRKNSTLPVGPAIWQPRPASFFTVADSVTTSVSGFTGDTATPTCTGAGMICIGSQGEVTGRSDPSPPKLACTRIVSFGTVAVSTALADPSFVTARFPEPIGTVDPLGSVAVIVYAVDPRVSVAG